MKEIFRSYFTTWIEIINCQHVSFLTFVMFMIGEIMSGNKAFYIKK